MKCLVLILLPILLSAANFAQDLCHRTSLLQGPSHFDVDRELCPYDRLVMVGDIHGSLPELLIVLHKANLTNQDVCEWNSKLNYRVLLIQTGDVVDRGPSALEAWRCLSRLQRDASSVKSKVVRLIGNHELLWMQNDTSYRNIKHDTPANIKELTKSIKQDIVEDKVQAAFALRSFKGVELVLTHAGLRPQLLNQIAARLKAHGNSTFSPVASTGAVSLINAKLRLDVGRCLDSPEHRCLFKDAIYSIGKDRGGYEIGGIFWTDFAVLERAAADAPGHNMWHVVQVVGHSMVRGKIRATKGLSAICIDVGLYVGGMGYLEFGPSGHFIAHERRWKGADARWTRTDLTSDMCRESNNLTI